MMDKLGPSGGAFIKKILMTASTWGHIRHFHLPYLAGFRQAGWEVHVGCASPPDSYPGVDRFLDLPFTKTMTAPENVGVARRLRQDIKVEGYDLLICHTSLAAFFTRLAVMGLGHRPRVINMVHGYLFDDQTSVLKRAVYWGAEKLTAPVTDVVLTMNGWDTDYAQAHRLGREVHWVPGIGLDIAPFQDVIPTTQTRGALGIPQDAFVMIYPAEFSKRKHQVMLIQAMTALPPHVHLILPGRGALLEECQSLAGALAVTQRVHFPGFVENMAQWYGSSDVAVTASRSEGLPFNVMEAMACGLPVIASDVKGHRDLVMHDHIGRLYPYDDIPAFVQAVTQQMELMPEPQEWRHERRGAVEPYVHKNVYQQILQAYGVTLDGSKAAVVR